MKRWVLALPILLSCASAASVPIDRPRTYLLSIVGLPLKSDESLERFSFATWGVEYGAVCRIPGGWRIKAGSSATPNGELEGEGSQGATWFNQRNPKDLRDFVLVTLYDAIQRADVRDIGGNVIIPATFKGTADISSDEERKAMLDYRNIAIRPASRCPTGAFRQ